jgi:hypothetical protein
MDNFRKGLHRLGLYSQAGAGAETAVAACFSDLKHQQYFFAIF